MRNPPLPFDPGGDTPIILVLVTPLGSTGNISNYVQDAAHSRYQISLEGYDGPLICSLTVADDCNSVWPDLSTPQMFLPLEDSVSTKILNAVEESLREGQIRAALVVVVAGDRESGERHRTLPRRWNTRPKGRFKNTTTLSSDKSVTTTLPPRLYLVNMQNRDNDTTSPEGTQTFSASGAVSRRRIRCLYVDPLTRAHCNEESSRPYDVARHLRVHVRHEDTYEASNLPFSPRLRDADPQRLMDFGVPPKSAFSGSAMRAMLGDGNLPRTHRRRTGGHADVPRRKRRAAHVVATPPAELELAGPSSLVSSTFTPFEAHNNLPPMFPLNAFQPPADAAIFGDLPFFDLPAESSLALPEFSFGDSMRAATTAPAEAPFPFPLSHIFPSPAHNMMGPISDHEPWGALFSLDEGELPPPIPEDCIAQHGAAAAAGTEDTAGAEGASGAEGAKDEWWMTETSQIF